MPTVLASTIIARAKLLAQDTTSVRWQDPEWLGWLSDGQREIVIIRRNAFTKTAVMPLVAGTKQSIPSDGIEFIEYIRNMGVGGAVPGNTARKVPRRLMDSQTPGWHQATPAAAPQHVIYEPLAPKTFYVHPPATGTTQAEILYSASPADVSATTDVIDLDDIYSGALLDYILYRAYAKDSEFVGNAERSLLYRKAFETSMGLKAQSDASSVAQDTVKG